MLSTEVKPGDRVFSADVLSQIQAPDLAGIAEEFSLGEFCTATGLHRESAESFFVLETKRGKFIVSTSRICASMPITAPLTTSRSSQESLS